ncbi:MAG: transcriptional repressor [Desulfurococcales archaeon]|nr:transcriptional repressor [Desulfurococcales archaeon]
MSIKNEAKTDEVSVEEVIRLLSRLNLRITPQRIYITKIILENVRRHPSFKEIYSIVKKEMPSIGVSTLFNTLKLLEKQGVISLFEYEGETHIDLPHPHVNVHCINTGKIIDVEDEESMRKLRELVDILRKNVGVEPIRTVVIVQARC